MKREKWIRPESRRFLISLVILLAVENSALSAIRYVPSRDYPTIQSAIDAPSTVNGDEVVVVPGVYTGPGNVDLDFKGKAITVRSQINPLNPNWNVIAATIIDCGGDRYTPRRAFRFHSGEGRNSKVLGFTIRNGYARGQKGADGVFAADPPVPYESINPADPNDIPRAERGTDSPVSSNGYGGAILCETKSSPTIRYCVITDCIVTGGQGGDGAAGQSGTWTYQPPYDTSDPNAVVPARVSVPDGQWGGIGGDGYGNGCGGGIACLTGSSPLVSDCIIKDNFAHGGSGGDGGAGGNAVSSPANAFPPNYSGGNESFGGNGGIGYGDGIGGGIYCENSSAPTIVNCTFGNNVATTGARAAGGSAGQGNAISADNGGPATDGASGFVFSTGGIAGGAAYYSHPADANFINCTFTGNKAYEAYVFYDPSFAFILGGDISAYTVGGAIYSDTFNIVALNTCDFINNMGCAVYCGPSCTVSINNTYDPNHKCLFTANSDPNDGSDLMFDTGIDLGSGGAIYLAPNCSANIQNCIFGSNSAKNDGGALKSETNITLKKCSFNGNTAQNGYGGAMDVYTPGAPAPLTIDANNCSFSGNQALFGGGFSSENFTAIFANCYFIGNAAEEGGGLDLVNGDVSINNSVIAGNTATDGYGGGVNCRYSIAKILHCTVVDNLASGSYPTGGCGGAINFDGWSSVQRVFNCLITGNSATVDGGAIYCKDATAEVNNCTFDNSFAGGFGGAIFSDWSSVPQITNCIFRNCSSHAIHEEDYGGDATATYCLFYNNSGGEYYDSGTRLVYTGPAQVGSIPGGSNNLYGDPLFVSGDLGSYYMSQVAAGQSSNSPAINNGRGTAVGLGLNTYTTRTDNVGDAGQVDRGYHYRKSTDAGTFHLTTSVVGGHGSIAPTSGTYYAGTVVTLTATPNSGWLVNAWTGTDNDTSTEVTNTVVMYSDRTVTVEFRQPRTLIVSVGGGGEGYYSDIQDAVTDANDGDTVVVYPGVYYSAYLGQVLVVDKSILITSRNPDDPACVAATIIDGFMGNQFYEGYTNLGVLFTSNTDKNTVLNGFTIQNCGGGFGAPLNGDRNAGHPDGYDGGCGEGPAIYIEQGAAPIIKNCVIRDNAVYAGDGGNGVGATNNENAGRGGWSGWAHGGAVYCAAYCSPTFINCQIIDNVAVGGDGGNGGNYQENGGWGNYGGTWSTAGSPSSLVYNIDPDSLNVILVIDGHLWELWQWDYAVLYWPAYGDATRTSYFGDYRWYSGYGGGAYCDIGSNVTFIDCLISGNLAQGGMSGQGGVIGPGGRPREPLVPFEIPSFGGGVYCAAQATVTFTGCAITDNISSPPVLVNPADPNSGLRFRLDPYLGHGGGVCAEDTAKVVFNNCTFSGNQASVGGGLDWANANPIISDSNFTSNSAYHGGGLFGENGPATIIGCDITNNEAVPDPNLGELVGAGGGVHCWAADVNIIGCNISSNQAEGSGGGVYFGGDNATPSLINCLITDNSAGRDGGGVSVDWYADSNIVNCTIAGNIVTGDGFNTGYGGGLYCSYSSYVNIINSIIWDNIGGIGTQGSQLAIATDYEYDPRPSTANVTYSDIQDATDPARIPAPIFIGDNCVLNWDPNTFAWNANSHNIDEDPLFVGGYYLSQVAAGQDINSPAVDAGSDLASVLGMDKYTTRIDGINDVNIVDMGYHYPPVPLARPKCELVLTVVGPGKVMVDPNAIDPNNPLYNPGNGVYTYKQYKNTIVRFTAIPASGYRVKSWSGTNKDPSWNKNTNTVKLDGDKVVRVEFERAIKQNILVPSGYRTIEEAVAAAGYGDTNIIVSQGVHYVSDPNGIDFEGKSITLTSTDPDDPDVIATTIIDCQGDSDTPRRAFHFHSGEDANTIVTGLTIRNGYMRGPRGAAGRYGVLTPVPYERIGPNANDPPRAERGSDATGDAYGGSILCENASSPTIKNCVITNCTVTGAHGGEGAAGQWVDPTYGVQQWYYLPPGETNLQQTTNGQWGGHGGTGTGNGYGGAIACLGGSKPVIIRCTIKDSVAMGGCGGDGGDGGYSTTGQESWGGNGGNAIGDGIGGGIYCEIGSTPVIADCNFINNVASTGILGPGGIRGSGAAIPAPVGPAGRGSSGYSTSRGRIAGGAAYYGISSDANFVNCTFFGNKAYELYPAIYTLYDLDVYLYTRGGALYSVANNNVTLNNCTFTGSLGGAVFIGGGSVVDVNKCLFEDNKVSDRTPAYYYYSLLNPGYALTDYERGGGAIYIGPDSNGVSIRNTNFHSNSAFYDGGAISCESDANFINCLFGGNEASRNGGAIEAYYDAGDPDIIATLALNLESCCFAGNQATEGITGWGGAVHFQDFNATFTDCQFMNNTARNGGGLFLSSGAVNMIGGIMHGNKAIGGSGINFNRGTSYASYYFYGGPSSNWSEILYGSSYYTPYSYGAFNNVYYGTGIGSDMSNSVDIGGGAVLANTNGRIENFTITDNTVEGIHGSGGAINFYGGYVTHTVKNCLITGNSASVDGGAISANLFAAPQIQNCTFGDNKAGELGGAIFCDWGSSPVVKDSIFRSCNSHAIAEEDFGDAIVRYCLFYGNQNGDYGVYDSVTQTTSTRAGTELDVTNKAGNPLFVTGPLGGYYLSQTPLQASNSPALNAGSGLASSLGMDKYTTRTDGVKDTGTVDIGFHYADHRSLPQFHLTAAVVGGHGRVEPTSGTYYAGTSVTITAIPDKGWRVAKWSGTINDDSTALTNIVIMGSNRTVTVQFGQPRYIVVGSDPNYISIQNAIDAAADGDVVVIPTGTYTPAYPMMGLRIDKGITLTSTNPDDPVCVRATVLSTYRLFVTTVDSEAIIDGITIRSGGIDVYSCSPTIRNCVFTECRIRGVDGGNLTIISDDGQNGASVVGGAMIIYNGSPAVQNCLFTDCSVTGGDGGPGDNGVTGHPVGYDGGWAGWAYGGAVYIGFGSNPTFEDCDFVNCYARGGNGGNGGNPASPPPLAQGGRGGSWEWADSIETGPMTGPYWYWWDGWQYAPYDANGAPRMEFPLGGFGYFKDYWRYSGYGGAVYIEVDSSPKFINCSFRNNHTYGGVSGIGGLPTLPVWGRIPDRNLNIENFGGAVYACNRSNPEFTNCEIANNVADTNTVAAPDDIIVSYGGGVAYEDDCSLKFVSCTIANNAACIGGGVYSSKSEITVADSSFSGNDAYEGGGLYSVDSAGTIAASSITDNRAFIEGVQEPNYGPGRMVGQGGGYCCLSSVIEVNDSIFRANEASFSGGGIYFGGSDRDIVFSPLLDNCLLTGNIAGRDGGGVSVNWNTDLAISNCTIADNKVTGVEGYGGGLYCSYDSNTVVIDSIIWDNGAINGSQVAVSSGFVYEPRLSALRITYTDIGPPYDPNAFTIPVIKDLFADGSSSGGSSAVLVDSQAIYSQFDTGQGRARVIVSMPEPVELKAVTNWDSPESVARFRSEVASRQSAVLSTLTPSEFTLRYRYQNLAAFSGEITRAGLEKLLSNPLVAHIEPVRYVQPALAQAIPLANALDARRVYDGKGVAIAIVDSGIDYRHPMLGGGGFPNSKVIGGYDTGNNDPDPMPVEPHGTCCAGIAAGNLGIVGDYIGGVAPGAKLYALKLTTDTGVWPTDSDLAGWDWCITHRNDDPKNPIKVMSNSWGITAIPFNDRGLADAFSPAHTALADTAVAAGITILAASHNQGYIDGITWPSAMSKVISVGAVYDTTDQVTEYSNTDEILDILAPADPVYTTDIVGPAGYSVGDYFSFFDGTSSACPFAAGCVADIQTAAKAKIGRYLTPGEVKSLLISTGDPVADWRVAITKPRVNLGDAVAFLLGLPGPPIYVEKGCELNGWEAPDSNNYWRWDAGKWPNSHNIEEDPNFICGYYLSQIAAGQAVNSPAVNVGSALASVLGMNKYTTRVDGVNDAGVVDMGYHYRQAVPKYHISVSVPEDPNDPGIHGTAEPLSGWYYEGTKLTLKARANQGYYLKGWYDVNDILLSGNENFEVVVDSNEVYIVRFRLPKKIQVSGGGDAVGRAVSTAENGDILIIAAGTYDGGINLRGKHIELVCTNPDDPNVVAMTIINCQQAGRGFIFNGGENADTVVDGFTIINGNVVGENGGGIYVDSNSSPTIMNVVISNCVANNGQGGGIFVNAGSRATFINCTVNNCDADEGGGAFCDGNSAPIFDRCTFRNNSADVGGGMYCGIGCIPDVNECTFSGNVASQDGGGLFCGSGSEAVIADCNFAGNSAVRGAGAYCERRSATTVTGSVFSDNTAAADGGAMYWVDASMLIVDSNIVSNQAIRGGGLWCEESGDTAIIGCTIGLNQAGPPAAEPNNPDDPNLQEMGQGGGLYCFGTPVLLRDCIINRNVANTSGGGVYLVGDANSPQLANCLIINNSSGRDGGGASVNWYARPFISNCTFAGNATTGYFGAPGNSGFGGGLYCSYHSNSVVVDSIFWNNFAVKGFEIAVATGFEPDPRPAKLTVTYCDVKGGWAGIQVDQGCTLLPADNVWLLKGPGKGNNIDTDPLFVSGMFGGYYLSQTDIGDPNQTKNSPCVDVGSDYAGNLDMVRYTTPTGKIIGYTTRTDGELERGIVDMGYHYTMVEPCRFCDLVYDGQIDFRDFARFASKWLNSGCSDLNGWCNGGDLTLDKFVNFDDLVYFAECWLVADTEAPIPNPSEWEIEPYLASSSSIKMVARTAFDAWGWNVEYYFDCVYGDCHDKSWQQSPTYTDTGLSPEARYGYRVKARDQLGNETEWSVIRYAGQPDITPPVPAPTWAVRPYAVGEDSIAMEATAAYDDSGIVYYGFWNVTRDPAGNNIVWQGSRQFVDVGLDPNTTYCYRVKARDGSVNRNETAWSEVACAATPLPVDNLAPTPNPAQWDLTVDANNFDGTPRRVEIPAGSGNWYATMRAQIATDVAPPGVVPSGVEYKFVCTSVSDFSSQWQTQPTYTRLVGGSKYIGTKWWVIVRDTSPAHNQTYHSSEVLTPPVP